jgi:hypothetical protein
MKKIYFVILMNLLLISCVGKNGYLIKNLTDTEKSKTITEKGKKVYKQKLVGEKQFDEVKNVRKYFLTAIKFNENNSEAKRYLRLTDGFKSSYVKRYLTLSKQYKNKKSKKEQDRFNMCFYVQKALKLDSKNDEAREYKKTIRDEFKKVIKFYKKKGEKSEKLFLASKKRNKKDEYALDGYKYFGRVELLDQADKSASGKKDKYVKYIVKRHKEISEQITKDMKGNEYSEAKKKVVSLYNYSIQPKMISSTKSLEYQVYYYWASYRYKVKKNYQGALYYVNKALKVHNYKKARVLKYELEKIIKDKKINEQFDKLISEIKTLRTKGKPFLAYEKVMDVIGDVKNQEKKNALKTELAEIETEMNGFVDKIYVDAINDFNDEQFESALKKFKKVLIIDENYKDASVYLKKSKEKIDLMESF